MRTLTSLATLLTLALGLTACGDDKEMTSATPTSDPPTTMTGSESGTSTMDPPTTQTDPPTTQTEPTTTDTPEPTGSTTEVDPSETDPSGSTTEVVDPSATDTTVSATDTTATGGGDESPYQACASDADCDMGGLCINSMVTGGQIMGSFCSPACTGPGNLCPDPAPGVQTSQAAQCIFGPAMMDPTNCAIICSVGEDECGPESDCEDIGQPPMMGVTLGVCSTLP